MVRRPAKLSSQVVPIFETPIYVSDTGFEALRPALLRFARALRRSDPAGAKRSNHGGWHSTGNLFDHEAAVVAEFERVLRGHVSAFLARLSGKRRRRFAFDLDGWVNVNGRGASNERHVHPNAFLSGAYYLDVPRKLRSGQFVVWDPRGPRTVMYGAFLQGFTFPWNSDSMSIDIASGRTVIFPAWLEHEVTTVEEDVERISIAFNVRRQA
jgi:uncharacterized protein (TIGR02466 family)